MRKIDNLIHNQLNSVSQGKINYQFKVLYVIGIFFVVAGHASADRFVFWNELIHAGGFHMALFIFASGYFYDSKNDFTPVQYILKKTKRLFVPYFLWNVFYGILVFVLSKFGFTLGLPVEWKKFLIYPFTSTSLFVFNGPSWFVFSLLIVELYNVFIRFLFIKVELNCKNYILMFINSIIGVTGVYLAYKGYNTGFMRFITRFTYFAFFYSLGYFYKTYIEKKDTVSNLVYFSVVVFFALIIILFNGHSPSYYIVDMRVFENPVLPFAAAICGIAFWLRVSRILSVAIGKSKYINLVADNTFSIMVNHTLGFFVLKSIFGLMSKIFTFLPAFDFEKFKTLNEYIYFPRGRGFPLLYVIFAIMFSILFQKVVIYAKLYIIKGVAILKENYRNGRKIDTK